MHKFLQSDTRSHQFMMQYDRYSKMVAEKYNSNKNRQAILTMIRKDVEEYKLRKKNRNKTSENEQKKRANFLTTIKQTFWVVQPDYEMLVYELRDKGNQNERYKKIGSTWRVCEEKNFFREQRQKT